MMCLVARLDLQVGPGGFFTSKGGLGVRGGRLLHLQSLK